jgi:hypothetical protein
MVKHGKDARQKPIPAIAPSVDEFDAMLADFRAADLTNLATTSITTAASPSASTVTSASDAPPSNTISSSSSAKKDLSAKKPTGAAMMKACEQGDMAQLQQWGRQGVCLPSYIFRNAVMLGVRVDIIRCLIKELSADINLASNHGRTALFVAAHSGYYEILVSLASEFGADVNTQDNMGVFPLMAAALFGHVDIIRYLGEEQGVDVNRANQHGVTSLIIAARNDHADAVRCLHKLGADVDQQSNEGLTSIFTAAKKGNLEMVRCLVKLGADISIAAPTTNFTPLMIASTGHHSEVVKFLVKAGADVQTTALWGTVTAAVASEGSGAPAEQTAYLEAKTHCSSPNCSGAGKLKCTGCKKARYCGEACQLAHWKVHKADCRQWNAELGASSGNPRN